MPIMAEKLYKEVLSLPLEARADLTERHVATLAEEIPSEIICHAAFPMRYTITGTKNVTAFRFMP